LQYFSMVYRILVADDQADCRQAIAALLDRPGFAIEIADNGADALRLLMEGPFDLSVLDVHMPSLSGIEVLGHLRRTGKNTPSILMTGNPTSTIEAAAMELGAVTMLHKPVQAEILRITVEQVFSRRI